MSCCWPGGSADDWEVFVEELMKVAVFLVAAAVLSPAFGSGEGPPAAGLSKAPQTDTSVADASFEELPLRSAEKLGIAPIARLPRASQTSSVAISDMVRYNKAGLLPVKNGFRRTLRTTRKIAIERRTETAEATRVGDDLVVDVSAVGGDVTMLRLEVEGAWGVRLHLEQVDLPEGTKMWVYGTDQEPFGPFGLELLRSGGDLYTPTVFSDTVWLEVETPPGSIQSGSSSGFQISCVMELFPPEVTHGEGQLTARDESCIANAPCYSSSNWGFSGYDRAVAFLTFAKDDSTYICSGGMVIDNDDSSFIPYLLTANHCFSSQVVAKTVESYWDYHTTTCNGSTPKLSSLPRVVGSTLLATGDFNDFSFVRLYSKPSGRVYLGWRTGVQDHGTTLYRISHPSGQPQRYSRGTVDTSVSACTGWERPEFIYSAQKFGGTLGGSSGSPVVLYSGYIVGQLQGSCGSNLSNPCDYDNKKVDGAFRETFQHIRYWLDPGTASCSESIEMNGVLHGTWISPCVSTHRSGAYAKYYTFTLASATDVQIDVSSEDDAYMHLLEGAGSSGSVIESNDDGGDGKDARISRTLQPGSYTIEATTYYANTIGSFDVSLSGSGGGGNGACVANATTLCLNDDRFRVEVGWRTAQGATGKGTGVEVTPETGLFWFFNEANTEMVIKVLDGCGSNGSYWVFSAGLTNVEVDITVTDTSSGVGKTYRNPQGTAFQPIQDTSAFSTCP